MKKKLGPVDHPKRRDHVWLHVDHFNKPKTGRVWAIQYWCRRRRKWIYRTCRTVYFVAGQTVFRGYFEHQPKGVCLFTKVRVISAGDNVFLKSVA